MRCSRGRPHPSSMTSYRYYCAASRYHCRYFSGWEIWHSHFWRQIQKTRTVGVIDICLEWVRTFLVADRYLFFSLFLLKGNSTIPPTRWLFSVLVPVLLMLYGLKRKGVNRSGAVLGLVVATILSIASHAFLACLATFFFSSSRATRYRGHMKRQIENDFKGGAYLVWANIVLQIIICICICRRRQT